MWAIVLLSIFVDTFSSQLIGNDILRSKIPKSFIPWIHLHCSQWNYLGIGFLLKPIVMWKCMAARRSDTYSCHLQVMWAYGHAIWALPGKSPAAPLTEWSFHLVPPPSPLFSPTSKTQLISQFLLKLCVTLPVWGGEGCHGEEVNAPVCLSQQSSST